MKKTIIAAVAAALALTTVAHAEDSFKRPDCVAYQTAPDPEARCFRKTKLAVRYANYDALQATGLEFVYLARPPAGKELDAYPEAKKAAMEKTEGEFLIKFSVDTNGDVQDVKIAETTSEPIAALAKLWADTIAQWKFAKIDKPVKDVPFRRLYLYSKDDDSDRWGKSRN